MQGDMTRKRGRPVSMCPNARESAVLDAAIALMSECGPEGVTMTDIARRAGMSKRTLYALYPSREELLGAGLARISKSLFRTLRPEERASSLKERLRILLTFNPMREPPEVLLEILRLVIAGARTYPDLGRSLSCSGPKLIVDLVAMELREARSVGEISLAEEEIDRAAELLVDMVVGNTIPALLDPDCLLTDPTLQAERRDLALRIFLEGVGASPN